eukprot:472050_1
MTSKIKWLLIPFLFGTIVLLRFVFVLNNYDQKLIATETKDESHTETKDESHAINDNLYFTDKEFMEFQNGTQKYDEIFQKIQFNNSRSHHENGCIISKLHSVKNNEQINTLKRRRRVMDKTIIGMCTMIRNEVSYLIEWLEYNHFIQQIDIIYLFDDQSVDNTKNIMDFYNHPSWLVYKTVPPPLRSNQNAMIRQQYVWEQCRQLAVNDSVEWLGILDVDEYIYALNHETIKDLFMDVIGNKNPHNYTEIRYAFMIFGTHVNIERFGYDIVYNATRNEYEMINSHPNGILTTIGSYRYHAPQMSHGKLQNMLRKETGCEKRFNASIKLSNPYRCPMHTMKSFVNTKECKKFDTHNCKRYFNHSDTLPKKIYFDRDMLKGNHYYFRFHENQFQSYSYHENSKLIPLFNNINNMWYNAQLDNTLAYKYHHVLAKRLQKLMNRCKKNDVL